MLFIGICYRYSFGRGYKIAMLLQDVVPVEKAAVFAQDGGSFGVCKKQKEHSENDIQERRRKNGEYKNHTSPFAKDGPPNDNVITHDSFISLHLSEVN